MLLEARKLRKVYGDCVSVDDVSLAFESGRIHAVLGENGAGKTTLMKLLFGLVEPSAGEVALDGEVRVWRSPMDAIRAGLGMVQQHFTSVETLSVIDNIMLGAEVCSGAFGRLDRAAAIARVEKQLPSRSLALPWHRLVRELSVGEKQRLEILKLLFRESRILFLDEPTAVLAPAEIEDFFQVLRQLKAQGRTIVLITHKINEVMSLCDTFAVLRGGRLTARGEVAEHSAEEIVERMIGRKMPAFDVAREPARGADVLRVVGVSDLAGRLHEVDLKVAAGEIVGIAGVDGSGQSPLVDAVMGLIPFTGEIQILGERVFANGTLGVRARGTGLIPEDRQREGLWLEESCHMNMAVGLESRFTRGGVFQTSVLKSETAGWAKDFDVRASSLDVAARALSGGNQQKLIFAREVGGRQPRFLICFQPTRGVDLGAMDLIHRRLMRLRNEGLGILLISSELDELLKLSDRMLALFGGRVSGQWERSAFDRSAIGRAMTGVAHG